MTYDTERRRQARMKVSPERRREIGVMAGKARAARLTKEKLSAIGRHGAAVRLMMQTPERLREISRLGAQATNRKRWGTP